MWNEEHEMDQSVLQAFRRLIFAEKFVGSETFRTA
jgi:hypothetical protein